MVLDILKNALRLIEEKGWTQNRNRGDDGSFCLDYALLYASIHSPYQNGNGYWEAQEKVLSVINGPTSIMHYDNVVKWNDKARRTVEDVKNVLKKAIENIETR